jgi:hypothetical protein
MRKLKLACALVAAVALAAPLLARAADEPAAPPPSAAAATRYKLVVEQYGVDGLIGSAEFTVSDSPEMSGVQL